MGGLLLLTAVFTGLLAMHGVQSTPAPSVASGLPGFHMSHADPMPAGSAGSAGSVRGPHAADASMAAADDPAGGLPTHQHPGGQVCLGLLVAAGLLMLLVGALARRPGITGRAPSRRLWRVSAVRPPPPSIFRLAVLRL
jgi:hypothetical protein